MMMLLIINLILLSVLSLYYFYYNIFYHWKILGVKQFPFSIMKGNLSETEPTNHIGGLLIFYYNKTKKLGLKFSGLYFNTKSELLVTDLELIKQILVKDFDYFPNHIHYIEDKDEPIQAHLFNLGESEWRDMRHKVSHMFTARKIKMLFGTMNDIADKLLTVIDDKIELSQEIDVKIILNNYITDLVASAVFGIECRSLNGENSDFLRTKNKIFSVNFTPLDNIIRASLPYLAKQFGIGYLPSDISDFLYHIVKRAVENYQPERPDIMSFFIGLHQRGELTIDQVAAQMFLLYIAG